MQTILPEDLPHRERHQLLLSGVAPRPIAFVSSIAPEGNVNLSPFSFFNAYSSKPPIVAIGPAIAARTGRAKDTLLNILEHRECTISTVSYSMVHKMNIASAEYPRDVDEYVKAGFSKGASRLVSPPYVAESPYSMECRLVENIEIRRDIGGNGNLMMLEVVAFHVSDSVMVDGKIDPHKMDLVARLSHGFYARTSEIFEARQPTHLCIGFDALPEHIRTSEILTGNDLARLAYVPVLPMLDGSFPSFEDTFRADSVEIELNANNPLGALYAMLQEGKQRDRALRHRIAKAFIVNNQIDEAWQTLLLE
ncbi:MAG: flavin reductase family protein [Ignavibacteria bacterium]|nr:flavin reductase family protein [Ignavibacteria bacterium]